MAEGSGWRLEPMGYARLRTIATVALAVFGAVMAGVAWDELVGRFSVPDAFFIPFFGLPAFFATMAWLARYLDSPAAGSGADQPRLTFGKIASCVFFAPGGAFYIAGAATRGPRTSSSGAPYLLCIGWALSCTGMQVSMLAELSGASPTITFDGLFAAFGTLNALVVITLMWACRTPSGPPLRGLFAPRAE